MEGYRYNGRKRRKETERKRERKVMSGVIWSPDS